MRNLLYWLKFVYFPKAADGLPFMKGLCMDWFSPFGFYFMAAIMIPNILFAVKCKEGFVNCWHCKIVEIPEQIGRFGCFAFMVVNVPGTWQGWPSDEAFSAYLMINTILVGLYCLIWVLCFRKNSLFRALALSLLPSAVFLFSGILSRSGLLTLSALVFAPCHILISWKNAKAALAKIDPDSK